MTRAGKLPNPTKALLDPYVPSRQPQLPIAKLTNDKHATNVSRKCLEKRPSWRRLALFSEIQVVPAFSGMQRFGPNAEWPMRDHAICREARNARM